ncbi:MAG: ATP-binding protein, partial [Gammaproteobacteria bacterium]
ALVTDIISDLQGEIRAKDAQIVVHELPVIHGDRPLLRTLFLNLLSNAIKFHKPDTAPSIEISDAANPADELVQIDIRDNGIGIEQEHQKKIFSMFQRLHVAEDYPGTGLGLTMCRRVALDHGGHISVTSKPDSGSVFSAFLRRI